MKTTLKKMKRYIAMGFMVRDRVYRVNPIF